MLQKVFGANVDWISQHSVFPEYFRQRFYETGELFPEFAANIGGGQNIYHFAYYGLYNPLLLPAYFLPFVKMSDYIMVISILCLVADVLLFYIWLRGNDVSKGNATLTTCMFLLAGPMIFHSYNQIMFINYMPFLLLSLMGVDRFFKKRRRGVFICGVFLMILTSFYFSVGGILMLVLYGVYRYWTTEEEHGECFKIRSFFMAGVNFCFSILTAVLSAGFLLIPTAMALLGDERKGSAIKSMTSLFVPDLEIFRVVYQPYGIGLTTCIISVLLTGITYKKWSEKYLHIGCIFLLTVPIFSYLLNGGLYIRDKALIPMLPVLCYLMALYLEKQQKKEISFVAGMVPLLLTLVFVMVEPMQKEGSFYRYLVALDAGFMLLCGLLYYWRRKEKVFVFVPIVFLFVFGICLHETTDRMLDTAFYRQVTDTKYKPLVEKLCEKEKGFYRLEQNGDRRKDTANLNRIWSTKQYSSSIYSSTYNADYQKFRQEFFDVEQPFRNVMMQGQVENPIFQRLMGVKYILSDEDVAGYKKKTEGIYERDDVYPIIYGTDFTLSQADFEKLKFPYNQLAFLSRGIIPENGISTGKELVQEIDKNLHEISVDLEEKKALEKICLYDTEEGDIFFLQFKVENRQKNKDVWVAVNGVKNKLSAENHIYYNENKVFTYAVVLENGQTEIQIEFGQGNYEISNVKSYIWKRKEDSPVQSEFLPDQTKTKGNRTVGEIQMKKNGYVITSIPYDKNFTVKIDNKKIHYEKVNTAFLGFQLDKGNHDVEINYHAPGVTEGKIITIIGLILWCVMCFVPGRDKSRHIQ